MKQTAGLKWRVWLTLMIGLFIVVPGSRATLFDGLPLEALEVVIVFSILVIIWSSKWYEQAWQRYGWMGVTGLLVLIQLIGSWTLPVGWSICLARGLETETLGTKCEPSAAFSGEERSYVVDKISFEGKSFPLHFMNEAAFNYTNEEEPDRHSMPYIFKARAIFKPQRESELIITTNTPNTYVEVNGEKQEVPFDEELVVGLEPGVNNNVEVGFETARADSDELEIKSFDQPYYEEGWQFWWWLKSYQLLFKILCAATAILSWLAIKNRWQEAEASDRKLIWYGLAAVLIVAMISPVRIEVFTLTLLGLGLVFASGLKKKALLPFFIGIIFLHSVVFVTSVMPYNEIYLLEGGDDTLTHENLARVVMKSKSMSEILEAGQTGVFYFQPLYRFIAGGSHKVLGEALWAPVLLQILMLSLAVIFSLKVFREIAGDKGLALAIVFYFAVFNMFATSPVKLALSTHQEAVALPLFLVSILYIVLAVNRNDVSVRTQVVTGLLWGLTVTVRTNLLPASIAWFLYMVFAVWKRKGQGKLLQGLVGGGIAYAIFPLLVVARNVVVAGKVQLLTTSLHPNLIDPFRILFPNIGGASDLTFKDVVARLLSAYSGRFNDLAAILWENMTRHYVGDSLITQAGWMIAYIIMLGGLIVVNKRGKIIILMLLAVAVLPALFGSLFLHRQVAVQSQVNMVLTIILVVVSSLLVQSGIRFLRRGKDQAK